MEYVRNTPVLEQKTQWTPDEYVDSLKKMKERTTAAPGLAFSHLKAIEKGSTAATVFSIMAVLPLLVRFAPAAWCTSVASMIPKKKEDLRPEKL